MHWKGLLTNNNVLILIQNVVPQDEIKNGLFRFDCDEDQNMGIAHVRWQCFSNPAFIRIVYEALETNGIITHPSKEEALKGWSELNNNEHHKMVTTTKKEGTATTSLCSVASYNGVIDISDIKDLVNVPDCDHVISHLWIVGNRFNFPMDLLKRCHAGLGADMHTGLFVWFSSKPAFVNI